MLQSKHVFLLIGLLMLSGCAYQARMEADLLAEISAARDAGEFDRALDIIDRSPQLHPQAEAIAAQRTTVVADIEREQKKKAEEVSQLARSGRWQEAYETLDSLDRRWRRSDIIIGAYDELDTRQQSRLRQLRSDMLVAEARWLTDRKDSIAQLNTLTDRNARDLASNLENRRTTMIDEMTALGHYFAEQQEWTRTRDLLEGARLLSGSTSKDPQQIEAERRLASVAHRQERAARQRVQQRSDELIERYRKTESISDLIAARDYLQQHNQRGLLDEAATRLESLSRERFRRGLAKGDSLYAAGDYRGAEQAWQEVSPLYPQDAELAVKMERVKRVLENLRSLSR